MNRRYFVGTSALAGAQLATRGLASANDTVRVACIGVRGQGGAHFKAYSGMPNVEIAAVCDVDEPVLSKRLGEIELQCTGEQEANAMFTRQYRSGFVVPQKV
jgi:hypothetical protein